MARNRRPNGQRSQTTRRSGRESSSLRGPSSASSGIEILYGLHPVREALRAGRRRMHELWIREGPARGDLQRLAAVAEAAGIPVKEVPRERIDDEAPAGAQTQGIALVASPIPELGVEAVERDARDPAGVEAVERDARDPAGGEAVERDARDPAGARSRWWVALDGVEDPQNVGAIARVADSAGAAGLILTERRASPLSPAVARASAGAIEWLPVVRAPNLARLLRDLRANGFWTVGATAQEGISLYDFEDRVLTGDLVIVLGAEGRGIRPGVLREIDHRVCIPMLGGVESLNVATAAAVLLYDLVRRHGGDVPSGRRAGPPSGNP